MNFNNVTLLGTVANPKDYAKNELPEMALAGRSNVGKSSFINAVVNRKSLARTSGTPGKTATINFYNIDDAVNLVDLPGYGYAKVSKSEKEKWDKMINDYLTKRETLMTVIQLIDIRHKPSKNDCIMMDWIKDMGFKPFVIATKADKISAKQREESVKLIREELTLSDDDTVIIFSSVKKIGTDEVRDALTRLVNNALIRGDEDDK